MDKSAQTPDSAARFPLGKSVSWVLAVAVLIGGGITTYLYSNYADRQEQRAREILFNSAVNRMVATLDRELNTLQVIMHGVQGYFASSESISRKDFRNYFTSLGLNHTLRNVRAIAYATPVHRRDLQNHIDTQSADADIGYQVRSTWSGDILTPITYIEPLDEENARALGYDISSNETARRAIYEAKAKNTLVITPPMTLIQDEFNDSSTSFVMYLPVYHGESTEGLPVERNKFIGWVDVPFRMQDLMDGINSVINPDIAIHLFDRGLGPDDGRLFRSHDDTWRHPLANGQFQAQETLAIGQREWQIEFRSTPALFHNAALSSKSGLALVAGGSLSIALALLVYLIARRWDQSEQQAIRMGNLYHALSEINQAIVRMDSEKNLFSLVCRMAVDFGGLNIAWISLVDHEARTIGAVAHHGEDWDQLYSLVLSLDKGKPYGGGVLAESVRRQAPVVENHYLDKIRDSHGHDVTRGRNWQAVAAFPIFRRGNVFAVLAIADKKSGVFDSQVVELLTEMADDIGFALDNFDREEERLTAARSLAENEARLASILENVGASIYIRDRSGNYQYVNREAKKLLAMVPVDADHESYRGDPIGLSGDDRLVLEKGEVVKREEHFVHNDGTGRTFWSVKIPLRQADTTIYGLCGISTDVSERKAREEQLRFLSSYDPLTGLPNRELIQDRLQVALEQARATQTSVAVLCIDLDRFKNINDSLGHDAGDRLLKGMAERLSKNLRLDATLSRMGGDNFVLVLPDADLDSSVQTARHLQGVITDPFEIGSSRLTITASIGIAVFPAHSKDEVELIQSADAALFKAKQNGANSMEIFSPSMRIRADETLKLETELRDALDNDQFVVLYQPQVEIHTGRIIGVEALIRWEHPTLGTISPAKFIPIAEQSGLIVEIGDWVLESAAEQLTRWRNSGLEINSVAVNLSVIQLYRAEFLDRITRLMNKYHLPARSLELEITEGIAMQPATNVLALLNRLRQDGVGLSIDDFGTGYSSMGYLKRFPIDKLKIDKSFIDGLPHDDEDRAIVLAIIGIGKALGFTTVAEGVETEAQWNFLLEHGCDQCQGYFFSPPQSVASITELLREQLA